jgi:glycine cleavage system H protein
MELPSDRFYSEYHLWVKVEDDQATIGITDYAKEELGEVDYIDLPGPDDNIIVNKPFGSLETSKAVTDLIGPVSGVVAEANVALMDSPESLTDDPYGDGWLIIIEPSDEEELQELMSAKEYQALVEDL